MKTIAHSLILGFALLGAPASHAQAFDPEQQLQAFATCAGRLSAIMEHQWLFDGAAADQTKVRRAAVLDLIDAIMPPERADDVLHWRIAAKYAQSTLLTRATFNDDAHDAAWAQEQAARLERACTGLLLS